MRVKKLQRFAELATFPNVFQAPVEMRGKWKDGFFKNDNPITLELGCGKGEYTLALARSFSDRNYIGVDLKGARLWKGAKTALEQNLTNAVFVRTQIEKITEYFSEDEVSEIWIPFPDPFPRKSKARKRLTSPRFLNLYRKILKRDGAIHLKTDDNNLFNYTLEILESENCRIREVIRDLYTSPVENALLTILTTYETRHLKAGRTINYLCFSF